LTTYYTYKRDVPLLPGQTLGFTPGRGYYAHGTPTPTQATRNTTAYREPKTPPPRPPAPKAVPPPVISEHGQGGGSGASDTGRKPTPQETHGGKTTQDSSPGAVPHAVQPTATEPHKVASTSSTTLAKASGVVSAPATAHQRPARPAQHVFAQDTVVRRSPPRSLSAIHPPVRLKVGADTKYPVSPWETDGAIWSRGVVLVGAEASVGDTTIDDVKATYNLRTGEVSIDAGGVEITDHSIAHTQTLLGGDAVSEAATGRKKLRDEPIQVGALTQLVARDLAVVHAVSGTVERTVAGVTFRYVAAVGTEIRLAPAATRGLAEAAAIALLAAAATRLAKRVSARGTAQAALLPYPTPTAAILIKPLPRLR